MFDVAQAVDRWCDSVYPHWWQRAAQIAELKDHLYCAIEQLQEEGWSAEQAFLQATEKMGTVDALAREYTKNRNFLRLWADYLQAQGRKNVENWSNAMDPRKKAFLLIGISLFFAVAIILSDLLVEQSLYAQYAQLVTYLWVAIWFVPFSILSLKTTQK